MTELSKLCITYFIDFIKSRGQVRIILVYALLPNKTEKNYFRLLSNVNEFLSETLPAIIVTNFKSGTISAIILLSCGTYRCLEL